MTSEKNLLIKEMIAENADVDDLVSAVEVLNKIAVVKGHTNDNARSKLYDLILHRKFDDNFALGNWLVISVHPLFPSCNSHQNTHKK
jgi:hypothetical protein